MSVLTDLFRFMKKEKKWWLVPMIVLLVLLGIVLVAVQGSAVAPFIYTLF